MFSSAALLVLLLVASPAFAQSAPPQSPDAVGADGRTIDGPPAPIAPATITRDDAGQATVRAIRLTAPLKVDGVLDEDVYRTEPGFGGLLQVVPHTGDPASEETDVWVMFDKETVFVGARLHDSAPESKWVANELRRDTNQLRQNDTFGVGFDTFYDRRSGFMFYTNALGALADYSVIDEGAPNSDWNPVWTVRTGRFDGGWTVELAIPFKSLRYRSGPDQIWGLQVRRAIRRKNEWTYLTQLPPAQGGPLGLNRVSMFGTLTGIDAPTASRNIEIKPYVFGRVATDRLRVPPVSNDVDPEVGVDLKYGLTANLTADLTYNTDFAQVEVDEQQVNLTRFSLFFPEKRDFFLEGRGIFDFARGGAGAGAGGAGTAGGGAFNTATSTPYLFYSRRVGLNRNRVVPIDVGGRVTGKVGKFGVGAINIQAGGEDATSTPSTNFTVLRVKRDLLRRSTVGAMFTSRSQSNVANGSNQAYGVDAAFGFYENLSVGGYFARTETPGLSGDDESFQGRFDYGADRYGVRAEYLDVGDNFNPEIGFIQRDNFRRAFASLRFSPRPKNLKGVRKLTWQLDMEHLVNGAGALETRQQIGKFNAELENSDVFSVEATRDYEMLVQPFQVVTGVRIPAGSYSFDDLQVNYQLGAQRRISGTVSTQFGHFYNGTLRAVGYTGARVSVLPQFSLEPTVQVTRVELPNNSFTTTLLRTRADYGFSPRMFFSALVQYSSTDRSFSSNIRYRWEYRPGSDFFVVYTDDRDTLGSGYPALKNRAFVVKFTRLFRL